MLQQVKVVVLAGGAGNGRDTHRMGDGVIKEAMGIEEMIIHRGEWCNQVKGLLGMIKLNVMPSGAGLRLRYITL